MSKVTAFLRSPAQKIQKILISFLGLYRFHPDYRLASRKYYEISLRKSSFDMF